MFSERNLERLQIWVFGSCLIVLLAFGLTGLVQAVWPEWLANLDIVPWLINATQAVGGWLNWFWVLDRFQLPSDFAMPDVATVDLGWWYWQNMVMWLVLILMIGLPLIVFFVIIGLVAPLGSSHTASSGGGSAPPAPVGGAHPISWPTNGWGFALGLLTNGKFLVLVVLVLVGGVTAWGAAGDWWTEQQEGGQISDELESTTPQWSVDDRPGCIGATQFPVGEVEITQSAQCAEAIMLQLQSDLEAGFYIPPDFESQTLGWVRTFLSSTMPPATSESTPTVVVKAAPVDQARIQRVSTMVDSFDSLKEESYRQAAIRYLGIYVSGDDRQGAQNAKQDAQNRLSVLLQYMLGLSQDQQTREVAYYVVATMKGYSCEMPLYVQESDEAVPTPDAPNDNSCRDVVRNNNLQASVMSGPVGESWLIGLSVPWWLKAVCGLVLMVSVFLVVLGIRRPRRRSMATVVGLALGVVSLILLLA